MAQGYSIVELADLAAGQWGLFTTAQGRAIGFSTQRIARLARNGTVERIRHGVYRVSGAPSVPNEQLRAAWLVIEPRFTAGERLDGKHPAVVSHRSAARVHNLGDLDADVMEFTVTRRKQSRLDDVRYRVATLDPGRWTLVDGLPTTTILSTIDDLATDHLDGGHLASIVRDAVTTGRADADAVVTVLRPHAHKYGVALGDGSGLLDRFLSEAGVPESTRALSRRVTASASESNVWSRLGQTAAFREALETQGVLAGLSESTAFREALVNQSAAFRETKDVLARLSGSTAFREALVNQSAAFRETKDVLARLSENTAFREALASQNVFAQDALVGPVQSMQKIAPERVNCGGEEKQLEDSDLNSKVNPLNGDSDSLS